MSKKELEKFKEYCHENNLNEGEDEDVYKKEFKDCVFSGYLSCGISGSNCVMWSEESSTLFTNPKPKDYNKYSFLLKIFEDFKPNITDLEAEKIKKDLTEFFYEIRFVDHYDDYQNCNNYHIDYIKIEDLFKVLKEHNFNLDNSVVLSKENDDEILSKKEIISIYKMSKSKKQTEALKTNFYLQGLRDYIDSILELNIDNFIAEKNNNNYNEGVIEAQKSIKEIKNQSTKSEYKNFINELQKVKSPSKSLKI